MAAGRKAIVVGALGVIGRYVVDKLAAEGDWEIVGLSRRQGEDRGSVRYVSVDLLDPVSIKATMDATADATHVFYAAFQSVPGAASGYAANIAPNLGMLVNSVSAVEERSSRLERVVLVTGTKTYGVHMGPYKTPARESDPRHMPPNYYFNQVDWLVERQRGKRWDWTELRPQTLCGFAPGTPMSIVPVIGVYAAFCRELGLPFRFPGKPGAYTAIYQVTDSAHFANACHWAALEPTCSNEAFNITNGDYFRWCNLWPRFAEFFGLPYAPPQTISLTSMMADKEELWNAIVAKHGLKPHAFADIAAWEFGDYVFGADWDVMSNVTKARRHGFHDVIDSEEMFLRLFQKFRDEKIIP
jgi:nucleoside-diphosphate-sugar epimerase